MEKTCSHIVGKQHVFGAEISLSRGLPTVVEKCALFLMANPTDKDLFFDPVNRGMVDYFRLQFDQGVDVEFTKTTDPHVVAQLLVLYINQLPSPLLPWSATLDSDGKAETLHNIVANIECAYRAVLGVILGLIGARYFTDEKGKSIVEKVDRTPGEYWNIFLRAPEAHTVTQEERAKAIKAIQSLILQQDTIFSGFKESTLSRRLRVKQSARKTKNPLQFPDQQVQEIDHTPFKDELAISVNKEKIRNEQITSRVEEAKAQIESQYRIRSMSDIHIYKNPETTDVQRKHHFRSSTPRRSVNRLNRTNSPAPSNANSTNGSNNNSNNNSTNSLITLSNITNSDNSNNNFRHSDPIVISIPPSSPPSSVSPTSLPNSPIMEFSSSSAESEYFFVSPPPSPPATIKGPSTPRPSSLPTALPISSILSVSPPLPRFAAVQLKSPPPPLVIDNSNYHSHSLPTRLSRATASVSQPILQVVVSQPILSTAYLSHADPPKSNCTSIQQHVDDNISELSVAVEGLSAISLSSSSSSSSTSSAPHHKKRSQSVPIPQDGSPNGTTLLSISPPARSLSISLSSNDSSPRTSPRGTWKRRFKKEAEKKDLNLWGPSCSNCGKSFAINGEVACKGCGFVPNRISLKV